MKTRIALGGAALALWCALTLAQTRLPSEQTAPAPPAAEPAAQPPAPAAGAPARCACAVRPRRLRPAAPAPAAPSQEEVIPLEPPPAIRLPGAPEAPAPEQAAPQTPQVAPVTTIFTVGDIKIEGLQRVSEGTVYNYLPVNIGDHLTPARVREAIRRCTRPASSATCRCAATATR